MFIPESMCSCVCVRVCVWLYMWALTYFHVHAFSPTSEYKLIHWYLSILSDFRSYGTCWTNDSVHRIHILYTYICTQHRHIYSICIMIIIISCMLLLSNVVCKYIYTCVCVCFYCVTLSWLSNNAKRRVYMCPSLCISYCCYRQLKIIVCLYSQNNIGIYALRQSGSLTASA